MCALLTWAEDGTRMHCGKKEILQMQWDAVGSVLLGDHVFILAFMEMLLARIAD